MTSLKFYRTFYLQNQSTMNKYSLIDLLTKELEFEDVKYQFSGIQIPMIQRDYAHGRQGEAEIRKRFLKAIFEALENKNELELDFVYGTKRAIDKKDLFIPLDGQQRLTTLYLLHWYIGNKELEINNLNELRAALGKFSYSTRVSSNEFCEKLSNISVSFNELPSKEIKNSSWFFDSFNLDPTVQSMLVMLDEIHSIYGNEKRELFSRLDQIKFYFLPLDGFDLTDELYIKMNARGKQLTQYENFKADLIKWIKDPNNPHKLDFQQNANYHGRLVKYHLYFELKLDNEWTNLFWMFSKKFEKMNKKLVDPYMMQFWNRYLLNSHIVNNQLNQDAFENDALFKELYGNQGDDTNIKYNSFESYKSLLEVTNRIKIIEKILESLTSNFDDITEAIKPNWDKNDKWNLFSENINQRQRIIFFATTKYLEKNPFDEEKFRNWMRIVWNIVIDPNIRSVPAMVGAMRFIDELSTHSNSIISFLRNPDSVLFSGNTAFQTQLEEEHFKASLISKSSEWEESIIEAESHPLFQGNIRFLLSENGETNFEYFQKIKAASFAILKNNDLSDKADNYLLIRALLAKSTNIQLPITLSNGRFNNWRYLINSTLMNPMRLLIDDISQQMKQAEERMNDICSNYERDFSQLWVYPLVNWVGQNGETLLGNYSVTRKVQKYNNYGNDPENVYLYNQTRWTESNILISNFRNEIVRELLKLSKDISFPYEWHNIQNHFFRGWSTILYRTVGGLQFCYSFDREWLRVGIKETEDTVERFANIAFEDSEIAKGWICRKKYNYSKILTSEDVDSLLQRIDKEVFDLNEPSSLFARIRACTPE